MDIRTTAVVIDGKQWQKDLPDLGDLEVLVAPWENKAFERELQKRINALPPALRVDGKVDPAAFYTCLGKTIATTILFDWKNFRDGDADKAFEAGYAETFLTDQRFRPFRDGVVTASKRVQQGLREEDTALAGNSNASSLGAASGEATKTV